MASDRGQLVVRRPQFSIAALLIAIAGVSVALAIFRYLNPPPVYSLPTQPGAGFLNTRTYAFGYKYEVNVTQKLLDRTPRWDRRNQNPPLSANEAMVLAEQVRLRLVKNEKLGDPSDIDYGWWELRAAELTPFNSDHWYWRVRFQYIVEQTGPPNELELFVLMDGTVVESTVTKNE